MLHLLYLHDHFCHVHHYFIFVVRIDELIKEQVPIVDNLLVQNLRRNQKYI